MVTRGSPATLGDVMTKLTATQRRLAPLFAAWPPQRLLRINSAPLFWLLIAAPLVVWWACVGAGIANFVGLPAKQRRVHHVMLWFDDAVVRPAGPALPFAILLLRFAVNAAADLIEQQRRRLVGGVGSAGGRRGMKVATLVYSCLGVYALVAVVRVVIYGVHLVLLKVSRDLGGGGLGLVGVEPGQSECCSRR